MSSPVLIVEDSRAMRAFVRASLETAGDYDVQEAENGFEALRILPRQDFAVVIVDINMPDINGLEVISFMRGCAEHKNTPLLIISTEASERDRSRAFDLGANGYLEKPFSSDQLLAAIAELKGSV